jgi:predicted Mrr-cat superfamily restriction endonuclease
MMLLQIVFKWNEYRYGTSGHKLGHTLGQVNAFVNTMKADDIVIVANKGWAHIGIVGDYQYDEQYDNDEDGMCHRRIVSWSGRAPISDLNNSIQTLLRNRNTIAQYPHTFEESEFSQIIDELTDVPVYEKSKLDNLFDAALSILEEELTSEDPDRRLKAATELIRLKKG